jgi:hypothetical protein
MLSTQIVNAPLPPIWNTTWPSPNPVCAVPLSVKVCHSVVITGVPPATTSNPPEACWKFALITTLRVARAWNVSW